MVQCIQGTGDKIAGATEKRAPVWHWAGGTAQCHLIKLPKRRDSAYKVGRTPWSARVPPDPPFPDESSACYSRQAGQGAGCGPGADQGSAPPVVRTFDMEKLFKWHWAGGTAGGTACPTKYLSLIHI